MKNWLDRGPLVAAALAFLVYLPSLAGGFLYDDMHVVVENRSIRDLRALGTVLRYEPSRPLLNLTWALSHALGGLRPWPYHLVNVLLHAGNAALVAGLFLWMAARAGDPDPRRRTLVGACLFAVTPMAAETVAYVASRSTALATLFALASLRLAAVDLVTPSLRRHRLALALFVLALLSKEEAASLPLLLLLLDLFYVAGGELRVLRQRWRSHAPFWALPLAGFVARRLVTGAWLPPPEVAPLRYLATQLGAFPLYFLRALLPLDPAFYRGEAPAPWPPDAWTLVGAAGGLALFGAAIAYRRRFPLWCFAALWLAAGLLPSSSLVALKEMVVDHRAYLGGAGVLFAVAGLLLRVGHPAPIAAILLLFSALSVRYEWVLGDPVRAWQDAVRRAPGSSEAHVGLAQSYWLRADPRTEATFLRALALDPANGRAWADLAVYYTESGRLREAEAPMRRAVQAFPGNAQLRDNLGLILVALGQEDEALREFETAVDVAPFLAQPRINLAELLIRRGEKERAAVQLREAERLEVDRQDAEAILRLRRQLQP